MIFPIFASMIKKLSAIFCALLLFAVNTTGNNPPDSLLLQAKNLQGISPDSALGLFLVIAKNAEKQQDFVTLAEAQKGCGVCYYFLQQSDSALAKYREALETRTHKVFPLKDSANLTSIAGLYHNMALVYSDNGDHSKAISFLQKSEKIRIFCNDKKGLAYLTYNNLGAIYFFEGDYDQAIYYLYKSLNLLMKMADVTNTANTLDQIGAVYFEQNDYEKAHQYYERALTLRESIQDTLSVSLSLNNLGLVRYAKKEFKVSADYFHRAIQIKTKYGDTKGLASAHNNLGLVFQDEQQLDSALFHYQLAVAYARESNDRNKEALALVNKGAVLFQKKQYGAAQQDLTLALSIAQENEYQNLIRDAAAQLADLYAVQGQYSEAFTMRTLEKSMSDSLLNRESLRKIAVAETQFRYEAQMAEDSLRNAQNIERQDLENRESLQRQRQITAFIVVLALLALIIVWLFFRSFRIRQKNREEKLLRETAELENILLRSQMNPHFIFNSMNSIQSFISENNTLAAGRHLSKFASLIRHILENSSREFITLHEELAALQLYMELEQARFRNKFSWVIDLQEGLDSENIQVPPLILQPFVENAILHGILHKESAGKIELKIASEPEKGILTCIILDDGVGRQRASELRKNTPGKRKSLGINISKERLERLWGNNHKSSMEVEDLFQPTGEACGTKVSLQFPLITD